LQAIAEPTVAYISDSGSAKIQYTQEITANKMADVEGEILLQVNLLFL